jgi:hypothetical protein
MIPDLKNNKKDHRFIFYQTLETLIGNLANSSGFLNFTIDSIPMIKLYSPLFLLICILTGIETYAQNPATGYKARKTDTNQKILEKGRDYDQNFDIENHEAFYLEGEDSLFRYLYTHIVIPKDAHDANLIAQAMISFQVNFDGKISNASSISKVGYGIDEQLLLALSGLEFVPATQGGMAYRSEVILEIPVKASYLYNIQIGEGSGGK